MTTSGAGDLPARIVYGSSQARAEWLFRALYGLPSSRALEIAQFALTRYLPIFQAKHPDITWASELLGNPEAWVAEHETGLVDDPDHDSADGSFRYGLYALLVAWVRKDDNAQRTAAVVVAIVSARSAFETNVWAADEPVAFTAWATKDLVNMRRTIYDNVAVMAVGEREWLAVVGQLASHPSPDDQLEAALERWRERDHMLL